MMIPPPRPQIMFPRPPQPMSPTGNTSWSSNVVNRMKPEQPTTRGPSPLDLLGQEALTAHKESQNKSKVENTAQPEKKDALLLDIGDSITPQPTPSIPPPPAAVPTSNGQQANETPLDQISLSMDKIKPGKFWVVTWSAGRSLDRGLPANQERDLLSLISLVVSSTRMPYQT